MIEQRLQRRTHALGALFFVPGFMLASWVTRTPEIRDLLALSTAQMGLILFGLSAGSMAGILASGPCVRRCGTQRVIGAGQRVLLVGVVVVAVGCACSTALLVATGLLLFGAGVGLADVAINIEGAEIERVAQRSVLSRVHGCFSLGTTAGALIGILATALAFPIFVHLIVTTAVSMAIVGWGIQQIPAATGRVPKPGRQRTVSAPDHDRNLAIAVFAVWKDHRLILIAIITLAMALSEGAANDWLPLLMVDGHGFGATAGSLSYAMFAAAMTIGRFGGGILIDRIGRVATLRAGGAVGTGGLAVVIFVDNPALVITATLLWGLGVSMGFPLTLSAAGDSHAPAARVSAVATSGYLAFLVGPPILGLLGDHAGIRPAMIVVLVLMAIATYLSPAVRTPQHVSSHVT
ncbi:MFS transporter [Rhodococcus koreensis]